MQKNYRPKKTQREHAAKARPQACLSALGRLPGEWDTTLLCSPCSLLCSKLVPCCNFFLCAAGAMPTLEQQHADTQARQAALAACWPTLLLMALASSRWCRRPLHCLAAQYL